MNSGWGITCPKCGAQIDEFSFADEWFCNGTTRRELTATGIAQEKSEWEKSIS